MSFIYPRLITISRLPANNSIGAVGYQGSNPITEAIIYENIQASIQAATGDSDPEMLPLDANRGSMWNVFFKLPIGSVNDRDIITDDLGKRYQVSYAYWNMLGYKCICERLQT